jgi:predicted amidohydrolase
VRVAAFQGPYLPFGSGNVVELIGRQLEQCERDDVDLLCCPEAFLGGLAYESDGQSPGDVAVSVKELRRLLAPLMSSPVASVVGFTERADNGSLYNSAAFLADGAVHAVYRKVYPGYRTAICAGVELPVLVFRDTLLGIMICNDVWYAEPARILASKGAALILVPTNSGHLHRNSKANHRLRTRAETLPVARAVDNTVSIVVADIAGEQQGRIALGSSRIIDPDGAVLSAADPQTVGLVIADREPHTRPFDPRGWDGHTNSVVCREYASALQLGGPAKPA